MQTLATLLPGMRRAMPITTMLAAALVVLICSLAQAQEKKPNILVILGDDVGQYRPSRERGHDVHGLLR
jgi:hypothetical protein